jgi:hypothetical protein
VSILLLTNIDCLPLGLIDAGQYGAQRAIADQVVSAAVVENKEAIVKVAVIVSPLRIPIDLADRAILQLDVAATIEPVNVR